MLLLQSFMDEASFYRKIAHSIAGLRAPRALWVHSDPWRQHFAVVMEPVPAIACETGEPDGFNAALTRVCLQRLAIFHASQWSEAGHRQGGGFWRGAMKWEAKSRFPECWDKAVSGLGLDQHYESLGRRLEPHLDKIRETVEAIPVRTMIHGDFKMTNVFVKPDRAEARGEVWAIDWQWY
ncbi:MAG: phosphotransferase, partial [Planctomycetes bacterium]|nr:phosphotransferase [Planctomycetota bacterium]